jgi:hypothetical protein
MVQQKGSVAAAHHGREKNLILFYFKPSEDGLLR